MSDSDLTETALQAAYDAWERQGLDGRADLPRNGATLLFKEAAETLNHVWTKMFAQDAITPDVLRIAREAAQKAADACLIATVDPGTEPHEGTVEHLSDGRLQWQPR
jgi:hypothetical protein